MKSYWNKKGWEVEQSARPTVEWVSRVVTNQRAQFAENAFGEDNGICSDCDLPPHNMH